MRMQQHHAHAQQIAGSRGVDAFLRGNGRLARQLSFAEISGALASHVNDNGAGALTTRFGPGEHLIGALWRRGELSIWNDATQLLTWSPKQQEKLDRPSATLVKAAGVKLGARRTLPLAAIRFDDDFMRESGNGIWRPLAGRWELTGMAFPEDRNDPSPPASDRA